jgi:hypothetical protein
MQRRLNAPHEIARGKFGLSRDDRLIYFSLVSVEADMSFVRNDLHPGQPGV